MSSVSVIIPCHNAERWIEEAIESCLQQTWQPVEIVVVDDGSTDGSLALLKSYARKIRLQVAHHQGASHARNEGFALSRGEYIQFLDADDYLLPQKIEQQIQFLEETGADAVYGDWQHRYEYPDGSHTLGEVTIAGAHEDILEALLGGWWTANMTLLLRREVVSQSGGWDETLKAAQDRDFSISIALSGADIRYQPGCHSVYRRHGSATVSTSDLLRWLESHQAVLEKAEARMQAAGCLSARYRSALASSFFSLARNYYDIDRSEHAALLHKTLSLSPGFRPRESRLYNLSQGLFGFAMAEELASRMRRFRKSMHVPQQE